MKYWGSLITVTCTFQRARAAGLEAARLAHPADSVSGDEGQADQALAVDQAEDVVPVIPEEPAPAAPVPVGPLQAGGLQVSFQQLIVIYKLN